MGEAGEARTRDAVVRPLSRAATRPCARPGCPAPARSTLVFRYAAREAELVALGPEPQPETYDLCVTHAGKTRPPHGWTFRDRRPLEDTVVPGEGPPPDLGGERTVALLAQALRGGPRAEADAADDAIGSRDEARASAPEEDASPLLRVPDPGPATAPASTPTITPAPAAAPPAPGPSAGPRPVPAALERQGRTVADEPGEIQLSLAVDDPADIRAAAVEELRSLGAEPDPRARDW